MRILVIIVVLIVVLVVGFALYVRMAPTDAAAWHIDPAQGVSGAGSAAEGQDGSLLFEETPETLLARLDAIAMATPRTERLAGSPEEGRITYITRSALFGFPDYTTVSAEPTDTGAKLQIFARLRFGSSDLGVNAERVKSWLSQL